MNQKTKLGWIALWVISLILAMSVGVAQGRPLQAAIGAGFTYQGRLTDGGAPANGTYDFEFKLFDDPTAGAQVGGAVTKDDVSVSDGLFTVTLDFGNVFDGTALYLEIAVRSGSSTGAYTTLSPRQALTAAPYANYAAKAPWSGLSGVPGGLADGVDNDTLSGLTCANGQVAQWNGSAWTCAAAGGNGDITAVTAGTGLTGGGASGDVTLSLDTAYIDARYWRLGGNSLTANGILGSYEVTANTIGAAASAVFTLSNIPETYSIFLPLVARQP